MSFSQEAVRARALEVRRERAVSVELLVLAFRRSGMSAGDVARVLGWKRTTKGYRVADSGRVYRYLGVKPTPGTRGYPSRYREFINYEAALAIAEAIGVDPVDVGL